MKKVVGAFRDKFQQAIDHVLAECKQDQHWDTPPTYEQGFRDRAVDASVVGPCFFPAVRQRGLVLIELSCVRESQLG